MNDGGTKSSADMERAREEELPEELYGELRRLAAHFMVDARSNHTLTPTALVHEVFLKNSTGNFDDLPHTSW